jgi:hypothetical protein
MRYRNDPYELRLKYPGRCCGCGGTIPASATAWYYPKSKSLYGLEAHPCSCGDAERAAFYAAAADEDAYAAGHGV